MIKYKSGLKKPPYFGEWLRGRALAWGARDRGFESRLPDHLKLLYGA